MRKIIRKGVNIDKLAQQVSLTGRSKIKYKQGSPDEKVWVNFQATKQQKRDFAKVCKDNNLNASAFLRSCILLLIEKDGDVANTVNNLKSKDVSTLQSKVDSDLP